MSADTQSILDTMTAGILDRKAGKSNRPALTPVQGEVTASPPLPAITTLKGDVFPHDGGITEQVTHSARSIRESLRLIATYADQIEGCLRSIEREAGLPEGGLSSITAIGAAEAAREEQRAAERLADEAVAFARANDTPTEGFAEAFERKAKAAQAQAFSAPASAGSPSSGWVCPTHGAKNTAQKVSKKGRPYRVCNACLEFEK